MCLGDRASQPRTAIHRPRLIVTRIPAGVESKSQFDRAEPARSCSRDTAARRNSLIHSPAGAQKSAGFLLGFGPAADTYATFVTLTSS